MRAVSVPFLVWFAIRTLDSLYSSNDGLFAESGIVPKAPQSNNSQEIGKMGKETTASVGVMMMMMIEGYDSYSDEKREWQIDHLRLHHSAT